LAFRCDWSSDVCSSDLRIQMKIISFCVRIMLFCFKPLFEVPHYFNSFFFIT